MRITVCFGGSILGDTEPDVEILKEMREVLTELREEKHEILVVTGGGRISRSYIKAARELGVSDKIQDEIGIKTTRLNAQLVIAALGDLSPPTPRESFGTAIQATFRGKIPVMGGTVPGHTTDAVAAELADTSDSGLLVFFTDVDGVYTADPKQDESAEKIGSMKSSELLDLVKKEKFEPGISTIIDPLAAEILQKSGVKTLILGKSEIRRLPKIVKGAKHSGTTITPG